MVSCPGGPGSECGVPAIDCGRVEGGRRQGEASLDLSASGRADANPYQHQEPRANLEFSARLDGECRAVPLRGRLSREGSKQSKEIWIDIGNPRCHICPPRRDATRSFSRINSSSPLPLYDLQSQREAHHSSQGRADENRITSASNRKPAPVSKILPLPLIGRPLHSLRCSRPWLGSPSADTGPTTLECPLARALGPLRGALLVFERLWPNAWIRAVSCIWKGGVGADETMFRSQSIDVSEWQHNGRFNVVLIWHSKPLA